MLKKVISLFLLTLSLVSNAQVGIGTSTPNASAILDVSSTSKGLLLPRLTTTQVNNISNPEPGLLVFNSETKKFMGYGMGTPIASISNTNAAGNGTWYVGLDNYSNSVTDDGQTFSIASPMGLSSISLWFSNFNNLNPGTVSVSVYTGNTPGSGNLVGRSLQYISTTGYVDFTFSSALPLSVGNYYFVVHAESTNMSGGLAYCSSGYNGGSFFQATSYNGGAFSYNSFSNMSLYFKLNYELAPTLMWNNLH